MLTSSFQPEPDLMTSLKLRSIFLAIICISAAAQDSPPAYAPTDHYLLDCGSPDAYSDSWDRGQWQGDKPSDKFSSQNSPNASFSSYASRRSYVPYFVARVFTGSFTYTFPLSAGPKFVRLFFYTGHYSDGFNVTSSYFSLLANNYTLLTNFSAYRNTPRDAFSFFKEFYLNLNLPDTLQTLNLTFNPNPNSYAFVNGIEVISVPDALYRNDKVYFKEGSSGNFIEVVKDDKALEVVYRFNVGGNDLPVKDDTGMFRQWAQDDKYLSGHTVGEYPQLDLNITYTDTTPNYTAPVAIYTSARTMGREPLENLKTNLTWVFPVHAGFMYLMRLHFCEFQPEIVKEDYRVFSIYINEELTAESVDVFRQAGGRLIPIYKDFAVRFFDKDRQRRFVDLQLELHPYIEHSPKYYDAILNGLEIFKVSDDIGSLGGANPDEVQRSKPEKKPKIERRKKTSSVGVIVGCVIGGCFLLGFLLFCSLIFLRRRQSGGRAKEGQSSVKSSWAPFTFTSKQLANNRSSKSPYPRLPSHICRRFTFDEIISATSNFDSSFIIGSGGFGNVYRGYIDEGTIEVAIKRLKTTSKQGVHEFQTEIELLSKLRHLHLVSLIGYSDDNGEMVLVYEYMSRGTLRDHLYSSKNPPLSWKKRLEVCLGAAKGLQYLHTGAKHVIIHRDVKSTNILLDENWVAKVSDFGLSKAGQMDKDVTHVSTAVKGSFGYLDPEYLRRQQLTEKSDVYSFGVVLLEVLSGRAVVVMGLPKEQVSLAEWGRQSHKKNTIEQIVDPNLIGQIVPECLRKFVDVAIGCLHEAGSDRPTMGDVVWALEFALQLQVSADTSSVGFHRKEGDARTTAEWGDNMFTQSSNLLSSRETLALRRGVSLTSGDEGKEEDVMRSGSVFSELSNSLGR